MIMTISIFLHFIDRTRKRMHRKQGAECNYLLFSTRDIWANGARVAELLPPLNIDSYGYSIEPFGVGDK